jgi:hypothetical protein
MGGERVASVMINKSTSLGELGRLEEEIEVYDLLVERFGDAPEPALRERVASVMVSKSVTLAQLERRFEEIAVYGQLVERFGDATEPALREQVVATALN